MPYAAGVYGAPSNSWNPAVAGAAINATDWAALLADLATALSTCVLKDGTQTLTANLPMGGFKLTGLAAGTVAGDSVRWEQIASSLNAAQWVAAGGTADAITAAYSPVNASLPDGLILGFRASAANTTTTSTFKADSQTAHTITKVGGAALVAGDIPAALAECLVRYNLANTRWELLNPAFGSGQQGTFTITLTGMTATITGTAAYSITNNVVTLFIPPLTGTSNTTSMTATGLPAAIQPTTAHSGFSAWLEDNTALFTNSQRVDISGGTVTFFIANSATGFTNSGTKGLPSGLTLTYNLN